MTSLSSRANRSRPAASSMTFEGPRARVSSRFARSIAASVGKRTSGGAMSTRVTLAMPAPSDQSVARESRNRCRGGAWEPPTRRNRALFTYGAGTAFEHLVATSHRVLAAVFSGVVLLPSVGCGSAGAPSMDEPDPTRQVGLAEDGDSTELTLNHQAIDFDVTLGDRVSTQTVVVTRQPTAPPLGKIQFNVTGSGQSTSP